MNQEANDGTTIETQWWFSPKVVTAAQVEKYSAANIIKVFANKHYKFDDRKLDYVVNIVGIRSNNSQVNAFNDHLWLGYWLNGKLVEKVYSITTDPGSYWLTQKPLNVAGCAILVPGQYIDKYTIRKHRGEYDAVCQKGDTSVKVYRDADKDGKLDFNVPIASAGGINIHRASKTDKLYTVDSHSAGCQVFQDPRDFNEFMDVCYKHKQHFTNSFTYTLLVENDFN